MKETFGLVRLAGFNRRELNDPGRSCIQPSGTTQTKMRFRLVAPLVTALAAVACCAYAQNQAGPMPAPPKFDVKRLPSVPHPGPPPIPQQEIIQRFAANEDRMRKIYETYTFTKTARIEEFAKPGGKFIVTGQVYTKPDGTRSWRIAGRPFSSLKTTTLTMDDVQAIATIPLFFLTTDQIANYNFLYAGQDKLDQLNTYVFQVKPKTLNRKQRFFEGAVWIDDQDLTIVKSYGKFVTEVQGEGTKLPFTMFETYRENFQGHNWLPTYTNSDDFIDEPDGSQVHLRLVISDTDFQLQE